MAASAAGGRSLRSLREAINGGRVVYQVLLRRVRGEAESGALAGEAAETARIA
jgi:hypothetical protein